MIPVDQTVFGRRGNCTAACLASIFEIDIADVPDLYQANVDEPLRDWWLVLNQWLADFNLVPMVLAGHQSFRDVWAIAGGPGPRGEEHSVVWRSSKVIHDPHPSRAGLLSVDDYMFFVAIDPARFRGPR